ncbi:Hpt domain-containing protein [Flavobacterium sp.]|uniref:Hpt domain-containing protein n=1 Tax=Flavobacterium sp. TaxID=239 RepID=UPI0026027517|nr:Hpt domain-containing protein [Flavobacterium sp.]MDG2431839.1 Hpt domain-containing protein [Flavobacterium sp.]
MEQPNYSYLNSFTGGDKEFEKKILAVIKSEFPTERNTYAGNIDSKIFDIAAKNVHKLKHKISLLGLEESYALANKHELNLLEGNNSLHDNFNAILDIMEQFLTDLQL